MSLYTNVKNDFRVEYISAYFSKISKSAVSDVNTAIIALCDTSNTVELVEERISAAHTMCTYMQPSAEDVIAILMYPAWGNGKASRRSFEEWYKKDRAERYFDWTGDAYTKALKCDKMTRSEQIDHYIMMRVCNKMFDSVIRGMNKKGVPDTVDIIEAYELAKKAHYWTRRDSGEPYLTHPISVAAILAEVGVDSSIIAAALLHDVVEDTEYTLEDIADKCGKLIARYVDAVTSVHKQFEASHNRSDCIYDKAELDAKSFEKLVEAVSADPRMVFALYIKAADRIHNLRTIDKMPSLKKHNKTDETELDYLPLFRKFKLNYFVNVIEDLTWRTNNAEYYESIKHKYDDIIERNRCFIDEMRNILSSRLGNEFNRFCSVRGVLDGGYDVTIAEKLYLTREVYGFAKASLGADKPVTAENVNKKTIPVCDFDVIVEPSDKNATMDTFITMFVKMFTESIAPTGRTIIDMDLDEANRFVVKVEDRHRTVFRLCFSTREDYISYRIGNSQGVSTTEEVDDSIVAAKEIIYVKLRNGKTVPMPAGSTVLDVAFVIHPEVGLAAMSATINGNPASIYNRVHDEDHVIVKADTYKEDGVTKKFIPHVKINWLNHVVTEKARKAIIKKLIKKYEEEDPANDFPASDAITANVVSMLTDSFEGKTSFEQLD